jgi:hypothetical protein
MSHRNMPQWNTSSVRDAFSWYPLTADLSATYPRQPPEKHSFVLMNRGEFEFSCLCPLTRQDWKVHKYSNFVFNVHYVNAFSATSYVCVYIYIYIYIYCSLFTADTKNLVRPARVGKNLHFTL